MFKKFQISYAQFAFGSGPNSKKPKGIKRNYAFQMLLVGICFLFFEVSAFGQCAMCRAALESGGDTAKAEAVNDGIVYLMVIPYILVGAIGIMIYISRKKKKELQ